MDAESEPIPAPSLTQFHPGHILFTLIPPHLYLGDSETCRLALAAQIRAFRVGRKFQRIIIRGGRSAHRRRAGTQQNVPIQVHASPNELSVFKPLVCSRQCLY